MNFTNCSRKGRSKRPLFKLGINANKIQELTRFLFYEYLDDENGIFYIDGKKLSDKSFVIAYAFVLEELGIIQRNINVVAYRDFLIKSIGEDRVLSHQAYSSTISKVKQYGMSFHELDERIVNAKQNQLNYMNLELWQFFKKATTIISKAIYSSKYNSLFNSITD